MPEPRLALAGFRYRWRRTPHRFPWLLVRPEGLQGNEPSAEPGGSAAEAAPSSIVTSGSPSALDPAPHFAVRIGRFPPDVADWELHAVRVDALATLQASIEVRGRIGHEQLATLDLALPQDLPADVDVVIGGFELRALDNPSGWHLGRLAVQLSPPVRGETTLTLRMRPSEAPEPMPFGHRPWSHEQPTRHRLDLTLHVVAARGPRRTWTAGVGEDEERRCEDTLHPPVPRAALAGFDFAIDSPLRERRRRRILRYLTGRYMREVGIGLVPDADGTRAYVVASNTVLALAPQRIGVLAGLGLLLWRAGTHGFGDTTGLLYATAAALVAALLIRWPGGPSDFPITPWRLDASVSAVPVNGEPRHARGVLRESPPATGAPGEWVPVILDVAPPEPEG